MKGQQAQICRLALLTLAGLLLASATFAAQDGIVAAKPLFRDPVHDGAADPTVVWNPHLQRWWMFYTNRRANVTNEPGVSWVHGTRIGIAESADGGAHWSYVGTADIPARDEFGGTNATHWAVEVLTTDDGLHHMFVTIVPGIFSDWKHPRFIYHLTSRDLLHWENPQKLVCASEKVIDACALQLTNGGWRLWYNNEADKKSIYYMDSTDLKDWTPVGKAVGVERSEGPKVFRWKGNYWMITDAWRGLAVYQSDDAVHWRRQSGDHLLQESGSGEDDGVIGGHPDVVVSGDRAYLFYFTHPGRRGQDAKANGYEQNRSSIQVTELFFKDGKLVCDRDQPAFINLKPPARQSPSHAN